MRLALGGAFGFVGPGFVVAAQSGNRDRVQGAVEVPVAGATESVSGPLPAAGLERSDTSPVRRMRLRCGPGRGGTS
jgi:hypothetical protein